MSTTCWRTYLPMFAGSAIVITALMAACLSPAAPTVDPYAVQLDVNCNNRIAGYAGPFESKELSGTVLSAGKPLSGVSIVAQDQRTGELLRATTDERGRFMFRSVGTATFEVFACKRGWSSMQFKVRVLPTSVSRDFIVELPSEQPPN